VLLSMPLQVLIVPGLLLLSAQNRAGVVISGAGVLAGKGTRLALNLLHLMYPEGVMARAGVSADLGQLSRSSRPQNARLCFVAIHMWAPPCSAQLHIQRCVLLAAWESAQGT
jgi:hypothetical protein